MLGWFADAAQPDAGPARLPSGQRGARGNVVVPEAAAGRHQGRAADGQAAGLEPVRHRAAAARPGRGGDARPTTPSSRPGRAAALYPEAAAAVRRHDTADEAVAAVLALRRRELLRTAVADLLGLSGIEETGEALTAVAAVTVAAALDAAVRKIEQAGGPLPTRICVVAMGRLGGHEMGYASDADVMFVHEPLRRRRRGGGDQGGARGRRGAARAAGPPGPRPGAAGRRRAAAGGAAGAAGAHPGLLPGLLPAVVGALGGPGPAARRAGGRRCRARRRLHGHGRRVPLPERGDRRGRGPGDPEDQGPDGVGTDAPRRRPGPAPQAGPRRPGGRGVGGSAAAAAQRLRRAGAAHHADPGRPGRRA